MAELVDADFYLGVERDQPSLRCAMQNFPFHRFSGTFSGLTDKFDTVVALAIIEHLANPVSFLKELSQFLVDSPLAKIVFTTPHPSVDWLHTLGSKIGLFSKHASEEHKTLLYNRKMLITGELGGIELVSYQRFLFGANQIAIFTTRSL